MLNPLTVEEVLVVGVAHLLPEVEVVPWAAEVAVHHEAQVVEGACFSWEVEEEGFPLL